MIIILISSMMMIISSSMIMIISSMMIIIIISMTIISITIIIAVVLIVAEVSQPKCMLAGMTLWQCRRHVHQDCLHLTVNQISMPDVESLT